MTNRRTVLKSIAAGPCTLVTAGMIVTHDPIFASIARWEAARAKLDAEMARIKGTGEDLDDDLSTDEFNRALTVVATVPTTLAGLCAMIHALERFDSWLLNDTQTSGLLIQSLAEAARNLKAAASV